MAYKPGDVVDKILKSDTALRIIEESQKKSAESAEEAKAQKEASERAEAVKPQEETKESVEAEAQEKTEEAEPVEEMPSLEQVVPVVSVGDIVEGTVVQVSEDSVVIDVGGKSEGVLPIEEFGSALPTEEEPKVEAGDKVEVYVVSIDDEAGSIRLSKKRADYEKAWKRILTAQESGEHLSAVVTERVKGGVRVDLGVAGFVPASHSGYKNLNVLDRVVGSTIKVRVIEADKKNNKVILSRRLALEEERRERKAKIFDSIEEGQILKGAVRSVVDYGAFVDVGGADGLLHISEMSWTRIDHPSELLKVNDEIEVMVLNIDREKERISLGLRQITPDPWQELAKELRPGSVLRVKVSRLAPRAAFVRLPNRIEGIIPITELDIQKVSTPSEAVQVGDEFEAQVMNISPQERKITLSKRRVDEKKQEQMLSYSVNAEPATFTIGDMYGDLLRSTAAAKQEQEVGEEAGEEAEKVESAPEEASEAQVEGEQEETSSDLSAPPEQESTEEELK